MRTRAAISIIVLSLASGAGGYLLRAQKTDGSLVLSLKDAMREEYLVPPDSFSRVKNTKSTLDALSARFGFGIMDAILAYTRLPKSSASEARKAEQVLEGAIHAGEAAMQEFEGTEQQLAVAQSLLLALQKAGRFDRWTEVYLKALYEYPTHPVVSRFANEAVRISKLAGKQKQVLEALAYLSAFPAEFAGRVEIEAALSSVCPCLSQVQISRDAAGVGGLGKRDPLN